MSLSAALLSSSVLRMEGGYAAEIYMDIASSIEAVILSFLCCRSGGLQLVLGLKYMYNYLDNHYQLDLVLEIF